MNLEIDLSGNINEIKWNGISKGSSWCRGSLIEINHEFGRLGRTKCQILDKFEFSYDFDFDRFLVSTPQELASQLKNNKKISEGCWKINLLPFSKYGENTYILFLNLPINDLIKELEYVENFATLHNKELVWI
jgi:hypothetical protein